MDTSRVSRRLAVFVLVVGGAFRITAAHEPPTMSPAIEQLPAPTAETKLPPHELANVLLEIRKHLGPSMLEGTLFQTGQLPDVAWLMNCDAAAPASPDAAFVEHIGELASGPQMVSWPAPLAVAAPQMITPCGATCELGGDAIPAAHLAAIETNHAQMQTAATVSSLRSAARQLEMAAGDIEDHARGVPDETIEFAWKRADELREMAHGLREKANSFMNEGALSRAHAKISPVSTTSSTCTAGACTSAACAAGACTTSHCTASQTANHQTASHCTGGECTAAQCTAGQCVAGECTAAKNVAAACTGETCTATVATAVKADLKVESKSHTCGEDCNCAAKLANVAVIERPQPQIAVMARLPHLGHVFKQSAVAPCEAMTPHVFSMPLPPDARVFTAVRIAPPVGGAPSAAQLEATIDHLTQELNELRSQLRLQTSRRVVKEQIE